MGKLYEKSETGCCPRFNPKKWDGKTVTWKNKKFVKSSILCFFHIPLNYGQVILSAYTKMQEAKATPEHPHWMTLNEDTSPWNSDLYIAVTKPVPGIKNVKISGKFLTKVFEGPFSDGGKWYKEMQEYVESKGEKAKKIYFWYTTCPKCSKAYGKNYVVLLAKI